MERTTQKPATAVKSNAFTLLKEDHKKVKKLFKEFQSIKKRDDSDERKSELVKELCREITVHSQIEEEIFYPSARQAIGDEDVMEEAGIEHASVKQLVSQLGSMEPGDPHYDAIVKVMGEYVEHHVREEEDQMFPMLKKAKLDAKGLGEQITKRKGELMGDTGAEAMPPQKRRSPSTGAERPRATPR